MTIEETTAGAAVGRAAISQAAIGRAAVDQVAVGQAGRRRRSTPDPRHLGRAMAWLARQVELGAADAALSMPQYRVLGILDPGPAISSALADRLAVRRPSVTAVVDGLVGRGLVSRRHDECDRRQVSHVLTAEGRRVLAAADRAVDRRLEAVAACLPDPELAREAVDSLALWQQALLIRLGVAPTVAR